MEPVLDLVRLELAELVDSVAQPDADPAFGIYVLPFDHPGAELGRHVEREVFLDVFGNTPELLRREYDPYEPASLFIVCVDHRRRVPAGVMRLLMPTDVGSKSLHDIERLWEVPVDELLERTGIAWDPADLWDVATLAVADDYRGEATNGFVSFALYQAFSIAMHRCHVDWGVAVLDCVVFDLIQGQMHEPMATFAGLEPKNYLDSPLSIPVWGRRSLWDERVSVLDPDLYALMCGGEGMEAVITHPDWNEVATTVARLTTLAPTRIG